MGGWLDWVILWVFSNLGDSMTLPTVDVTRMPSRDQTLIMLLDLLSRQLMKPETLIQQTKCSSLTPLSFQCFRALQLTQFPTSNDKKYMHVPRGTANGTCSSARGASCYATLAAAGHFPSIVLCHRAVLLLMPQCPADSKAHKANLASRAIWRDRRMLNTIICRNCNVLLVGMKKTASSAASSILFSPNP